MTQQQSTHACVLMIDTPAHPRPHPHTHAHTCMSTPTPTRPHPHAHTHTHAQRAIAKDVPRTDRKGDYFRDDMPHRLQWLNDILVTYAVFHPAVGYAQGMNDVLSMILAVMDHEADAYWCFEK